MLDNWSCEAIHSYARENDLSMTLSDAYDIVEQNPQPPYGWVLASNAATNAECFSCVYWNEKDAREDAAICKEDGFVDVEITDAVDHEKMCEFLQSLLDEVEELERAKSKNNAKQHKNTR